MEIVGWNKYKVVTSIYYYKTVNANCNDLQIQKMCKVTFYATQIILWVLYMKLNMTYWGASVRV